MKTPQWIKIDVPRKIGRLGLMKGDNVYEKMSDGGIGKHAGLVIDPAHGKKVLCSWVDAPDTPEQMGVRQLMKATAVGCSILHGGKRYVVRRYIPGGAEYEVFEDGSSTEDEEANAEEEEENAEEEEENAEEEEEEANAEEEEEDNAEEEEEEANAEEEEEDNAEEEEENAEEEEENAEEEEEDNAEEEEEEANAEEEEEDNAEEEEVNSEEETEDNAEEEEENSEEEEGEEEEPRPLTTRQIKRNRTKRNAHRRKLQKLRQQIPSLLTQLGYDLKSDQGPPFHSFIQDVARMYEKLRPADDALYLTRRTVSVDAISTVFSELPANKLPYQGDVNKAAKECDPILEALFDMPSLSPRKGMLSTKCIRPYVFLRLSLFR
jgi:hypothetical protein